MTALNTDALEEVMALIQALFQRPDGWMNRQTLRSTAPLTVEESYELLDAIESGNAEAVCDELGDLLIHVLYYSLLLKREYQLDMDHIARSASDKLKRRHPSLLDGKTPDPPWEIIKAQERSEGGYEGPLADIPSDLPALMLASRILKRRADASAGSEQEIAQCVSALQSADTPQSKAQGVGALLLLCVTLAQQHQVNPEQALRHAAQNLALQDSDPNQGGSTA